ncbi:MAG: GTP-binding protein [Firmicutes bacterium]|nr:GTP-binding protein [Bacillota bacterium]
MTQIDIYSGFLGAGKTTLIKKLIAEGYAGQKIVLIENEFGEIGIDGGFLKDAGVEINEINSGCICCSLTGDFKKALLMVDEQYHPDRIVIEPSGVGKLSEVAAAVMAAGEGRFRLGGMTTVVDCKKAKMYIKNFGEFFNDQVATANCVALSRVQMCDNKLVEEVVNMIRLLNPNAVILTVPWDELSGKQILEVVDGEYSLSKELESLIQEHIREDAEEEEHEHHHHHHHNDDDDDDDDECCCGHHHHDDDDDEEEEHEHNHHHHHDDDDDDDDDECCCGHHHHHHHHGDHDADEVFTSWGKETAKAYSEEDIKAKLTALDDTDKYGMVVRAKGIVACTEGGWIHFDYTPGEAEVRKGAAAPTGLLCVIGVELKTDKVEELFEA